MTKVHGVPNRAVSPFLGCLPERPLRPVLGGSMRRKRAGNQKGLGGPKAEKSSHEGGDFLIITLSSFWKAVLPTPEGQARSPGMYRRPHPCGRAQGSSLVARWAQLNLSVLAPPAPGAGLVLVCVGPLYSYSSFWKFPWTRPSKPVHADKRFPRGWLAAMDLGHP